MARITTLRERVHYAYEFKTPQEFRLDGDQSFIILQVAVPPQEDVVESDALCIKVDNGEPSFHHPLRPLMDMYRSELRAAAETYLRIEVMFEKIIDAVLEGNAKLDQDELLQLHALHRKLRFGHTAADREGLGVHMVPQAHAAVGVLVARAIAVPPRRAVNIHCTLGSKVTVYVGGLASRTVE